MVTYPLWVNVGNIQMFSIPNISEESNSSRIVTSARPWSPMWTLHRQLYKDHLRTIQENNSLFFVNNLRLGRSYVVTISMWIRYFLSMFWHIFQIFRTFDIFLSTYLFSIFCLFKYRLFNFSLDTLSSNTSCVYCLLSLVYCHFGIFVRSILCFPHFDTLIFCARWVFSHLICCALTRFNTAFRVFDILRLNIL